MKARKARKLVSLLLGLALVAGALSGVAMAAEEETYVLMNIPYGDFYAAELDADAKAVDAVTSATLNKPRTGTLAGGSYHVDPKGTDISGVIYPVLVKDPAVLEGLNKVDDTAKVEITVTNRGKESTTAYEGADALFEAPSYSYYVLSEKPAYYKELTEADGVKTFSAVKGETAKTEGVSATLTMGGHHTDVEIVLENTTGISGDTVVSGVVLTASDGTAYGLRHVYNIWRGTQLGWDLDEDAAALAGKTITNIRYITRESVIDYPVSIAVSDARYVLMDIPYSKFYAAELGENDAPDAVSAATSVKRGNGSLAGGSYHVGADGQGVDGVVYPVFVPDVSALDSAKEIKDDRTVSVTYNVKKETRTDTYTSKDSLFEAEDYSWYPLTAKPARSKALTVGEDGAFTFSAVGGRAATVEGVTGKVTYNGRHTAIEIALSGMENVDTSSVSAVVLTTDDGAKYGLGHVTNLWRGTQLGWNLDEALAAIDGKTITNIRYITQTAVTDLPVKIPVRDVGTTGYYDIPKDAAYTDAVLWAKKAKITNGTGNGTFSPDATVDRATMVTFLWKQAGQPEPTTTENPFADVSESDWYYKAVLWAVENKVTDGTGKNTFSPKALVDRAQIMTFLWKAAGRPAAAAEKALSDVADTAWYHDAAQWAAGQGLLSGDTLEPKTTCTRAQVVELLYRSADK